MRAPRTTSFIGLGPRLIVVAGLGGMGVLALGASAGADIITPPGACVGSATFAPSGTTPAATYNSTSLAPNAVITIPRADSVAWAGRDVAGAAKGGGARAIAGSVSLVGPFGIKVGLWSWSGTSSIYENHGTTTYNVPSLAAHLKLTLSGSHSDGATTTCTGTVQVQIAGGSMGNPLAPASIGGLVVFGSGLVLSGRRRA